VGCVISNILLISALCNAFLWACGSMVGWGTMLQARRSRIWFPMRLLDFFNLPNSSSSSMALGSTHPLTEMSTRNIFRVKGASASGWQPHRRLWVDFLENVGASTSTILRASTACYRGSFTFFMPFFNVSNPCSVIKIDVDSLSFGIRSWENRITKNGNTFSICSTYLPLYFRY
jgi:hypothetical protein